MNITSIKIQLTSARASTNRHPSQVTILFILGREHIAKAHIGPGLAFKDAALVGRDVVALLVGGVRAVFFGTARVFPRWQDFSCWAGGGDDWN